MKKYLHITTLLVILFLLSFKYAQALTTPNISYTSPAAYTVGTTIPTLSPSNSGGAVGAFGYGTPVTFKTLSGSGVPFTVSTDAAGNIYTADESGGNLYKYSPTGTLTTLNTTTLTNPTNVTVDNLGNIFVSDFGTNKVYKFTSGGTLTATYSGFDQPYGIAIDASNNAYIVNRGGTDVFKIPAGSGNFTVSTAYISGLTDPYGINIDAAGNLYISSLGGNKVVEVPAGSTTPVAYASGFNAPRNVFVDNMGNIYVADYGTNTIKKITGGTVSTIIPTGGILNEPRDMSVVASGIMYIANSGSGAILKATPTGGYFINAALPDGLSFNSTNGQITGTPNVAFSATTYTITGYNTSGVSTTTVTLSANAIVSPTTNSVSICGAGAATLTASGGSPAGGTYNWYTAATGGTLLQSSTSTTYTATVSTTTNYYVSYTVGAGTSNRSASTITVNSEPVLSTAPTTGGLTLSYPFTAGSLTDASGNGNTAIAGTTEGSPSATTDRYGAANAYAFNGSSQYITSTTNIASPGPQNFSISIWFKTSTAGGKLIGFGGSQTGQNGTFDRHIYMDNGGHLYFGLYNNAVTTINTTGTYADGNWHHAVATESTTTGACLYVDGALQASDATMTASQSYAGYWRIAYDNLSGWTGAPSNYYFKGSLDDIAVYTTAITASQVYALYGAGSTPVCVGSPLSLQAATVSNVNYSWTGPNGFTSSEQNPTVTASCDATDLTAPYVLTITSTSTGCSYSQNVYAAENAVPSTASFTLASSVATNTNTTITLSSPVAGDTYSWDFGGGTPTTGTGTGPFSVKWTTMGAKTVTLTETNPSGCSTVTTKSITVGGLIVTSGNYAFSQPITLNTSSISNGGISSTLSNFPVLVYIQENALIATGNCANNVQFPTGSTATNGYDFAFTMQGSTNELFYQVESYNATTGTLLAWVNVPTLTSTNTALTFYFGSLAPGHTTAFTQATWANDYAAVYHFDEGALSSATGYVKDATSNANNLTESTSGVTLGASEVRSAAGITAATSAYVFKGAGSLKLTTGINIPNTFTLSAWINLNTLGKDQKIMTNQTASVGGYKLGVYLNNIPESETTGSVNRGYDPVAPAIGTSAWHYVQNVFDGSKIVTYVDGNEYQVQSTTSNSSSNNPFYIGVGEGGNSLYFYGTISEPRVSSLPKTSDWINAEYYNQTNPTTFTMVGTTITGSPTNAAAIGGSIPYTWLGGNNDPSQAANWICTGAVTATGTTTGTLNIVPPQDGTSSLIIPSTTNYPVLPAFGLTIPIYSLTLGAGAQIYLNGNTLAIGCHIYNNGSPGGIISSGSSSSSTITAAGTGGINFNGRLATQYFYGASNSTVNLANLAVSNTASGGIVDITGGPVNVYNQLSLTSGNITVDPTCTLTLVSNAAGTANVGMISSGSVISGNVSVQRYITGNSTAGYLGYRMLTSPVNISSLTSQTGTTGFMSLSYLGAGMETGGPLGTANGFDATTTNPLIYFYNEARALSYATYIGGKNVGVYSINSGNTVTTYGTTLTATKTTAQVPVGNSYQIFFVGTPADGINASLPHSATITALGYLNQGTIPVHIFNGVTNSTAMTYTTGTGAIIAGLSQVGNPYASTIDLDSLYFDNKTTLSNTFYVMTAPGTAFVTYNAASHTVSSTAASPYIASGQGFFAGALPTASSITFFEKEKVNTDLSSSSTPALQLSQRLKTPNVVSEISAAEEIPSGLSGLHLQITKDSVTYTQTGIYFNKGWSDKFVQYEDAIDMDAASPVVYLSSYSTDGSRLSINQMGDYSKGKLVKLYTSATSNGTFTMSLVDINNIDPLYNVYLRDHHLNDSVDLRTTGTYSFTINKSDTTTYGANRFDVVIELKKLLPYQLESFAGQKVTTGIQLSWNVSNPGTYTGFVLQKQASDNNFNPIFTTQSNNSTIYNFVDTAPVPGNNTYRLAQSDFYGNITYSAPVTIGYNNVSSNGYFSVYPNPSKDIINILVNSTTGRPASYTADIYNTSGTSMEHRTLNTYSWTQDVSSYKEGVYIIVLKNLNGDILAKSKFIKIN